MTQQPIRRTLLCLFALVFMTVAAYWPALSNGFIFDDDAMLTENGFIQSAAGIKAIWFSTQLPDYFPMTSTSLWMEWMIWGKHAIGYHITNLLLHIASAVLLWRLLVYLRIPGAYLAALLFVVHPVNVESVAWIAERKNTLSLLFYFAALFFFVRSERLAEETRPKNVTVFYILALVAFVFSLLSKTAGVMLPFVLLLCARWMKGELRLRDLSRTAPFFALSLAFGLLTVWFQYHRAIGADFIHDRSLPQRIAAAGWAIWFYCAKVWWPAKLSFNYADWKPAANQFLTFLPLIALIAAALLLWLLRKRKWIQALFLCLLFYVLNLLPVIGVLKIYFHRYALVADHWQYFSIAGWLVFVAAALSRITRSARSIFYIASTVLVLLLATLTFNHTRIFRDNATLWSDTLAKNPQSWLAHNNVGLMYERSGNRAVAAEHYQESLRLRSHQVEGYNNYGSFLLDEGKVEQALQLYRQALPYGPNVPTTHYNIGNALDRLGKRDEALKEFRVALQLNPFYVDAHNNLGCLLVLGGDHNGGIEHFRAALAVAPHDLHSLNNLGSTLVEVGRAAEAIPLLNAAVEADHNYADAHYNLANALAATGQSREAAVEYAETVRLNPQMALAHSRLGGLKLQTGDRTGAAAEFDEALRQQPNIPEAHLQLGQILQSVDRFDEAYAHYKAAVHLRTNSVDALNNLAWLCAASPNALHRDGDEALTLAQRAVQLTGTNDPAVIDTLAAAYAQSADYDNAVKTLQHALTLAKNAQQTNLVADMQARLTLYREHKPYREKRHQSAAPVR